MNTTNASIYLYVQYKDVPYRVLKADGDLIVLPRRYAEELRQLPPSRLSSLDAQFEVCYGTVDVGS